MRTTYSAWILAAIMWPGSGQTQSAANLGIVNEGRPVRIRVLDQAGVPAGVMGQARGNATSILRQAGVEATWLECHPGEPAGETRLLCDQDLGEFDFWLHVAARRLPWVSGRDKLGAAMLDRTGRTARHSYAYYPDIQTFAKNSGNDAGVVLAAVMVHEIGHLLLGENHSRIGIMRAGLSLQDLALARQGALLFTADEARAIRAKLSGSTQTDRGGAAEN